MTYWKTPPRIKIYEALGAIADKRIETSKNSAKIHSSSGNKFYTVKFDPTTQSIMSNDNGSYWQGYLGYPAITFLLTTGVIPHSPKIANLLRDIKWKDINTKFKNNWGKTEAYVKNIVNKTGGNVDELESEIEKIYQVIKDTKYPILGSKKRPPIGY